MVRKANEVRHVSELPDWFQLKRYERARALDTVGWCQQLEIRFLIYTSIPEVDGVFRDFVLAILQCIQHDPIMDAMSDERLCGLISRETWELMHGQTRHAFGVRKMAMRDLYWAQRDMSEDKRQHLRRWVGSGKGRPKDEWQRQLKECKDWINEPMDSFVPSSESSVFGPVFHTVRINAFVPDKVLIGQFTELLRQLKTGGAAQMPGPDFSAWCRYAVLPYLDLWFWSQAHNRNIPNRVMADAIFPSGEGGEETVRKTTSKLAFSLLTLQHIETLEARAAGEIAERTTG